MAIICTSRHLSSVALSRPGDSTGPIGKLGNQAAVLKYFGKYQKTKDPDA
jgi:hypothetical protein